MTDTASTDTVLRRVAVVLATVLACLAVAPVGRAQAAGLVVRCGDVGKQGAREAQCDVRALEAADIQSVSVTAAGVALQSEPVEGLNQRRNNAVLFLLQSGAQVREEAREVERLLTGAAVHGSLGVFSYADALATESDLGASESELRKGLSNLKRTKPTKVALQKALTQAIDRLGRPGVSAARKFIVLVGDGHNEDEPGGDDALLESAKRAGVTIVAIALPQHSERLAHLAEGTGGIYQDVGAKNELPQAFVSKFYGYLENGGLVRLRPADAPAGVPLTFTAKLSGGGTVAVEGVALLTAEPVVASLLRTAIGYAKTHWPVAAGSVSLLFALMLAATSWRMMRRRRRRATPVLNANQAAEIIEEHERLGRFGGPTSARDTLIVGQPNGSVPVDARAWLEVLDTSAIRVPLVSRHTRIGRHKDNDIQINNNSVHRRHAVLHITKDGKFVINDLATSNGVFVNGKRVEQQELADGDVIELGEVRVQFVATPASHGQG
jgi:hypothetical protein